MQKEYTCTNPRARWMMYYSHLQYTVIYNHKESSNRFHTNKKGRPVMCVSVKLIYGDLIAMRLKMRSQQG